MLAWIVLLAVGGLLLCLAMHLTRSARDAWSGEAFAVGLIMVFLSGMLYGQFFNLATKQPL